MKLLKLFLFLGFGVAGYSQGTPYDCFSVFSFSGTGGQTAQNNSASGAPCVAWRVTYTSTGFSSVTVKFQTSADGSNWTDVVNSICSSSVQPPCVTDGANPLADGVMGSSSFRAYGKYVRVTVTGVTGSGSGQIVTYGYKGTSASAGLGGGGSSGTSPVLCTLTAVSSKACTHNFGLGTKVPWVVCNDASGNELGGSSASTSITDIVATSTNVVTMTFSGSTTGVCQISTGGIGPAGPTGPAGSGPTTRANQSKSLGTVYQNTGTTTKWVCVVVTQSGTNVEVNAAVDTVNPPTASTVGDSYTNSDILRNVTFFFPVLPGEFYSLTKGIDGTASINTWVEWN